MSCKNTKNDVPCNQHTCIFTSYSDNRAMMLKTSFKISLNVIASVR